MVWSIRKELGRSTAMRFVLVASNGVSEWSAPVWRTNVSEVWEARDKVVDESGKESWIVWGRTPNPMPWEIYARLWSRVKVAAMGEVIYDD